MAALSWVLSLLCVAGCHRSSASPVLRSVPGVQVGQNVSLTCEPRSSEEVTWYLLPAGSDQLQALLTITLGNLGQQVVVHHSENISHMSSGGGDEGTDPVTLKITAVEERDGGMYFCSVRCQGFMCFNRGTLLSVDGADGTSATVETSPPCWSLGICVLPASLVLVLLLVLVLFLGSGKPAVCSCRSGSRASAPRVTEDDLLHYSCLKHMDQPRPPGQQRARLVRQDVTYSAVASRKNPTGSRDRR
ncbi:uncharacterized protein [Paralichthys olivaceus]|uniref:uncharacterized protein isoform X2 n=1 Tax=Paralichthys olivaceus TaxID=8255 RepID=UPI003750AFB6